MKIPFLQLPEFRVSVIYLIVGCLWIVGSDLVVDHIAALHPAAQVLQSYKGLNFVLVTALLLFAVLRRSFGGWRLAEKQREEELIASSERFRELSARLQAQREEDRTEISREIHDELGQQLTAIQLKLGLAERWLDRSGDKTLNALIDLTVETSELVDQAIDSVRRVASGLRPPALDHLGLAAALEEEARDFTQLTQIPCRLHIQTMDNELSRPLATAAFRIFQESLTNVARHAHATEVLATCEADDQRLLLTIEDNGRGMDAHTAERPLTLGLLGMWERARNAGGELNFRSSEGHGTTVRLVLPLCDSHPLGDPESTRQVA
ncbi:signal transduction histidine kinase [Haloferula luteola]|uniref:histidine kinase n=1 Tax=Haloferula luteola TaxID=595692 RepID=A0A840V468_9BACT|nr:sensor histidine kinase [Haloferula luteola]MBB5350444.1 signal transduction histidine kinase [Haloferula luteola]